MTQQEFIGHPANWDNHRVLLWLALQQTYGNVVEFGMGDGSTRQLHQYCVERGRPLWSFDNNSEWAEKFMDLLCPLHIVECHGDDWDAVQRKLAPHEWDLAFVDHAPGERRRFDISLLANKAKIIVIHDSEPHPGYALDLIWPLFRSRVNIKTAGAWATAVSNFVDLSPWVGAMWDEFTVTA